MTYGLEYLKKYSTMPEVWFEKVDSTKSGGLKFESFEL